MHSSKGVFLRKTKINTFAAQFPLVCIRRTSERNQLMAPCLIWHSCKHSHLQLSPPLLSAGIPRMLQGQLSCSRTAALELQKNWFVLLHRQFVKCCVSVATRVTEGQETKPARALWADPPWALTPVKVPVSEGRTRLLMTLVQPTHVFTTRA